MIMNRQYIAPATEVVEIENQQMMLTQSNEQTETGSGNSSGSGEGTPDFASQKRGTWGDLWD